MEKKIYPKHSNDIHLFIINGLLVAALIGVAIWLQENDSDAQSIIPAASTTVEAAHSTASSSSDLSYIPAAPAPIKTSTSTPSVNSTTPIQTPIPPKIITRRHHEADDD